MLFCVGLDGWLELFGMGWPKVWCARRLPCKRVCVFDEVVTEYIRNHWILRKKGQKVNLGKYHQTTYTGIRDRKVFSTKGLCYAVACAKLGYWKFDAKDPKKAPAKTGVLFSQIGATASPKFTQTTLFYGRCILQEGGRVGGGGWQSKC